MQKYFDFHYDGPAFDLFGTGHLITLAIIGAASAFLIWGWRNPGQAAMRRARLLIVGLLLLMEVAWHSWNLVNGTWNIREHLPLHACSISVWGSIFVLLTRSYRVYEIIFFAGIAGAGQSVLTPDAGIYGLPHFRAIQTLGALGLIGSNYMYTIRRPATASILDLMGPWPWYLVAAEFIAVLMFALLYVPFALSDRRAKRRLAAMQ